MSNLELNAERPPYQIISRLAENIEIRKYPSLKWACTNRSIGSISTTISKWNVLHFV